MATPYGTEQRSRQSKGEGGAIEYTPLPPPLSPPSSSPKSIQRNLGSTTASNEVRVLNQSHRNRRFRAGARSRPRLPADTPSPHMMVDAAPVHQRCAPCQLSQAPTQATPPWNPTGLAPGRHPSLHGELPTLTAAPFSIVAMRISCPGQSTNETCRCNCHVLPSSSNRSAWCDPLDLPGHMHLHMMRIHLHNLLPRPSNDLLWPT